jgi:phage terminase large subunit-like protein
MTRVAEEFAAVRALLDDPNLGAREAELLETRLLSMHANIREALWEPYPWQVAPSQVETLGAWLMLGGRGTGKTEGGARYLNRHMMGPPCDPRVKGGHRASIIAPTVGDAYESCVTGPSGITTVNPDVVSRGGIGGQLVRWPNGSTARLFGAYTPQDVERLRAGGNRCIVWAEEVAAMRYLDQALEHTNLGLRIGPNPHYVMTTTPKPRAQIKALIADPHTIITHGRTSEAHKLDPSVRARYFALYEGTRLGRQELDAEVLDDVEGALWTYALIDGARVPVVPPMDRIVVSVDPPGTSVVAGREAGIVVVGRAGDQAYVLSDLSGEFTPHEWGTAAVSAYHRWQADGIVAETNYGGEMVVSTLRSIPGASSIPIYKVVARRGKALRAQPVVSLYEQARAHHVGVLAALETQLTGWVPGVTDESPDRLDALVHGMTHLMVVGGEASVATPPADRRVNRSARSQTPRRRAR